MTMKKIFSAAVIVLLSLSAFAQKSNYVFFTENGEPFTLMLNGITYNSSPQSNVKAEQLNAGNFSVRIVFADKTLGAISDQLVLNEGVEVTFMIKRYKASAVEKEVKKIGKGHVFITNDSIVKSEKEKIDNDQGTFKLEFLSKTKVSESTNSSSANNNPPPNNNSPANMPEQPTYRGSGDPLKGLNVEKSKDMVIGNYYALIIGVNKYHGTWTPLQNAVADAKAIEAMLKSKYKFDDFKTMYDEQASRVAIIEAFDNLAKNAKPEDNVFIYYSGHGEFKQELNKGFWVPQDAKTNSVANYISNADLQAFLGGIKSKHTLLVADACFSGDIFRGNTVSVPFEESEKYYKEVHGLASRQAMTSGGIEPVMDGGKDGHSVFAYYLLKTLNENQSKYMDVGQIYNKVKIPVINNSEQSPKLAPVKNTGDEGGQFVFIKK